MKGQVLLPCPGAVASPLHSHAPEETPSGCSHAQELLRQAAQPEAVVECEAMPRKALLAAPEPGRPSTCLRREVGSGSRWHLGTGQRRRPAGRQSEAEQPLQGRAGQEKGAPDSEAIGLDSFTR